MNLTRKKRSRLKVLPLILIISLLLLFTPLLVFIFAFGAAFFYLAFYEFRVDTDLAIYSIISIAVMFVVLVCQCALLLTYLK